MEGNINKIYRLLFVSIFLVISCKHKEEVKEVKQLKELKMDTIYFADESATTTTFVNCSDFLQSLTYSVSYLLISDNEVGNILLENVDKVNIEGGGELEVIDVRYKIVIDSNIICLDDSGYCIYNNKYIGKFKKFDYLKSLITNNRKDFKRYKELPIPEGSDSDVLLFE